ncbi:hypothetical protein [Streptomyces zagrosensis]|uniref:Uncharacterized protein n=1 Tax=Streptomyces zagrosensis TaxID=1042984 RepID=A0A7W9QFX3_9ACTN|nr:hypothetical protein [Streptomyces zagrosensis]MBB5939259.1 hypothetical protein [Streptomyces zagrosensis]
MPQNGDQVDRIEAPGLARGAVIAQSLDNQWVTAELTKEMIAKGRSLRDVDGARSLDVRAEYFRSLINTRQVVVNRVYFYNNLAVSCDFLEEGTSRRAHQDLLCKGALVPFLLQEREPTDRPLNVDIDETAFESWRETIAGLPATARLKCVRLSWDDVQNRQGTRAALFNPFAARVQGLTAKDMRLLATQVGVPQDRAHDFARAVGRLVEYSNELRVDDKPVTRNVLYQRFISVPGSPVSDGRYDKNKPFSGEIKQLLDLIYNVNLADAMGMYPLTPAGSLRRLALQEWRDVRGQSSGQTITDPEALVSYLKRQAFDTVQAGLTPAAIDSLELADIVSLRDTDEWNTYIDAFDLIISDPTAFNDHVNSVFRHYVDLNRKLSDLASRRTGDAKEWAPVIEIVVNVGGAVFTAITGDETWSLTGAVGTAAASTYGGSVQLVLRNRIAGHREQKFARELANVRFDTKNEWEQFQRLVERLPGYRQIASPVTATSAATMQDDNLPPEY